jgi:hypothetical protein
MTVVLVNVVFMTLPKIYQNIIDLGRVSFLLASGFLIFQKTINLKQA